MKRKGSVNVRKGAQGFQRTTKGQDAPTSGDSYVPAGDEPATKTRNPVDLMVAKISKAHEWMQRYKNTGNLVKISEMFGFEGVPTHDSGGWVNNNQGGPGYRSVSPPQSERMFAARRLDEVAARLSANAHGKDLQDITYRVAQIREKLKESSRPYAAHKREPGAEQQEKSAQLLDEVYEDIYSLEHERESP